MSVPVLPRLPAFVEVRAEQALRSARYVIVHKLVMPDQYKRSPACLLAEVLLLLLRRRLSSPLLPPSHALL